MKRIFFILAGLSLWLSAGHSQNVEIPGVINHYLQVKNVLTDRVLITSSSELSYFNPGDKVLLIQMTGTTMPTNEGFLTNRNKYKDEWRNAGMYEILQIDQVITGANNYVVFTDDHVNDYDNGERIQLVRLVEGDNVKITGDVFAKPWDGFTGGIIAIIGMDSVKLNANIDAGGSGFRGGMVPAENYTGGCRRNKDNGLEIVDTLHFDKYHINRSGNKGEGIVTVDTLLWPYTKGSGCNVNGGGAGNGLFSGGGGGSNYVQGGDGGQQSNTCVGYYLMPSQSGLACYAIYDNNSGLIMGGGGGTGVQNLPLYTATNGGNGGGMVIIITGTLVGETGKYISVDGQSVTTPATGSGGGGGGAGTVILDASGYAGSLSLKLRGGDGGPGNSSVCTGSGGGGSGGILWHSGPAITGATVALNDSAGESALSCLTNVGSDGVNGVTLNNLILNLTGFLFNSLRVIDNSICEGQVPNKIKGSRPKGGNGIYTWKWEQSPDSMNWIPAIGIDDRDSLKPPALTQTTWYRRIVNSLDKKDRVMADTSRVLKIHVYPAITNNIIAGTDTLCYNLQANTLTGTAPSGGNNSYNYQWQLSADQTTWDICGAGNTYDPGKLQQSLYFRRHVTSTAYCAHTSNSVKITVLPSITNNAFGTSDTVICKNLGPGLLNASTPMNGDGAYSYLWQSRSTSGSWNSLPSSNVSRYDPGTLSDTALYRRIVYSGNGQACKDTSAVKTIRVLPLISANLPSIGNNHYCAGETPEPITGSQPLGGNLIYSYQWLMRTTGQWNPIGGATGISFTPVDAVDTTTQFSRIVTSGTYTVTSGTYHACHDTSTALVLNVVPVIQNTISAADQAVCENGTPAALDAAPAERGLGGFTYEWLQKEAASPGWVPATGVNDQVSFAPGVLTVSTLFSRRVLSDNCADTSNAITVTVYPFITGNSITGSAVQYTCFNSDKQLPGSQPANGSGSYAYEWQYSLDNTDWSPAGGTAQNYTSPALSTTRYFRRVVFSSPVNRECSDTSSAVEVRLNALPTGDVISGNDTVCAGGTVAVTFNTAGVHAPFSVTIGGRTRSGITSAPDTMIFTPPSTQSFTLIAIEDDSGCFADPALFTGEVNAVVYAVPVPNAGTDDEICGTSYTLQAVKNVPGSSGLWSASGATFSDPADPHCSAVADQYGAKIFTWTETNWQCSDNDRVRVIFYEQPATPDAGADQVLDFVYTTTLQAAIPPVGSGQWTVISGAGNFNNDTLADAVIYELDNETQLKWSVHNGNCPEVSDEIHILINPLVITKGFSPNGDTKNDAFDLGAVNAEKIRIKIYNSTGVLVFESDDYSEGSLWDGHNQNGVELPEGTYYYVADIKVAGREKEFQFRSFVEILR